MKSQKYNPLFIVIIILGIVLFNSCIKDDDLPNQLLINGNVDLGSDVPDNWWYSTGYRKYIVDYTDEEWYSPYKSIKISTQTPDTTYFAFWAQTICDGLPKGVGVTLRAKIKGSLSGEGVSIAIRGDESMVLNMRAEQFVTTQDSIIISGNFDWTEYSVQLNSVDESTDVLRIYLVYLQNTTGEVYFDDISLTY